MADEATWTARALRALNATPVDDLHTHLYDPGWRAMLLWGVDDLLVYHYLVSEAFRAAPRPPEGFWNASKVEQATWIWQALFVGQTPLSEACRGVLTSLRGLGLDPRATDLGRLRSWFDGRDPVGHVEAVLKAAGVRSVCMTNSPFDPEEQAAATPLRDERFESALRVDPLLLAWPQTRTEIAGWGYRVSEARNGQTAGELRRFLADWTLRLRSRYCMVSLPPDFAYPSTGDTAWVLDNAVLPHCRDLGQPLALMLGVRRAVNPRLRLAGDGVGRSDLSALQNLCLAWPENRFMATCLARENQHELAVLARKFNHLHPFGCWWFTNTPRLVEEITEMRLELLGPTFTAQHSDARVLDQLIYKWAHAREAVAPVLGRRYARLDRVGWTVTDAEIARDAEALLGGSYRRFLEGIA